MIICYKMTGLPPCIFHVEEEYIFLNVYRRRLSRYEYKRFKCRCGKKREWYLYHNDLNPTELCFSCSRREARLASGIDPDNTDPSNAACYFCTLYAQQHDIALSDVYPIKRKCISKKSK